VKKIIAKLCLASLPAGTILGSAIAHGDTKNVKVALFQSANPQGGQWYNCAGSPPRKVYASALVYAASGNAACLLGVGNPATANFTTGTTQTFACNSDWVGSPVAKSQVFITDDNTFSVMGPVSAGWLGNVNTGENVSTVTTTLLHLTGSPANCNNPALSYYMTMTAHSWGS
jgi:hypothetical protein